MNPRIRAWVLFAVAVAAALAPKLSQFSTWSQAFTPGNLMELVITTCGVVTAWLSDRPAVAAARQEIINQAGDPSAGPTEVR